VIRTRGSIFVACALAALSLSAEPTRAAAQEAPPVPEDEMIDEPPEDPTAAELELARRALEIEAREKALQTLEAAVRTQIQELKELQQQTLLVLEPERAEKAAELRKLVSFYQNMKPQKAATLLEKLPVELATQVLSSMKQREAGKILNVMNPARAVLISKRMAEPIE